MTIVATDSVLPWSTHLAGHFTAGTAGPHNKIKPYGLLKFVLIALTLLTGSHRTVARPAQNRNIVTDRCSGPIYNPTEVTKRAKIIQYPDQNILDKIATQYNFHGKISANAVLCRTGRVTDIQVSQKLETNVDELIIAAIGTTKFTPAELNWHSVSERLQFEFSINDDSDIVRIDPDKAEGRIVERLEITGYRTIDRERIMSWIKTRPGEPFNKNQFQKDFESLLASGYFDPRQTRVYTETGFRGGVGVVFEVFELPFIKQIKFEGLKINESTALESLKTAGVETGARWSPEKLNHALEALKQMLASQGQQLAKIELQVENLDPITVNLDFVILNR